jgi:hypothetical protein
VGTVTRDILKKTIKDVENFKKNIKNAKNEYAFPDYFYLLAPAQEMPSTTQFKSLMQKITKTYTHNRLTTLSFVYSIKSPSGVGRVVGLGWLCSCIAVARHIPSIFKASVTFVSANCYFTCNIP